MLCCIEGEDVATGWLASHWTTLTVHLSIADRRASKRSKYRLVQASVTTTFIEASIQKRRSAVLVGQIAPKRQCSWSARPPWSSLVLQGEMREEAGCFSRLLQLKR